MASEYEELVVKAVDDLYSEKVNDTYGKTLNTLSDVLFHAGVLAMLSHNTDAFEGLLFKVTFEINSFIDECNTKMPASLIEMANQRNPKENA